MTDRADQKSSAEIIPFPRRLPPPVDAGARLIEPLTRIVIAQRERTVAIRAFGIGLVAQTLNEQRDLNDAGELFDRLDAVTLDPEMVTLAVQLVDRQTAAYDPADMEDQYETRLRAMLDAKDKGEEAMPPTPATYNTSNVVDLRAALMQSSLAASPTAPAAAGAKRGKKAVSPEEARRQLLWSR